ncbi:MAG TPA: glycosyltransferase, partial [Acidimicrobiia bacterium]|nr:glycosyltransferase [Acidimicrobiia bacterium]
MPRRLAILSLHTSPLAQPGTGDGGGMNVYVRSVADALARAGVRCDVYTRSESPEAPPVVTVGPGVRVHHVVAGPTEPVPKEQLPELTAPFTHAMEAHLAGSGELPALFHANYWLSGVAGHALKHEFGLPLVSTFHTLARVKAEAGAGDDPDLRARHPRKPVVGVEQGGEFAAPGQVGLHRVRERSRQFGKLLLGHRLGRA